MKSMLLPLSVVALLACGGTSSSPRSQDGTGLARNCETRCQAVSAACHLPDSSCVQLCGTLTEAQLECIEQASCSIAGSRACLSAPSSGGADGGVTTAECSSTPTCNPAGDSIRTCKLVGATQQITDEACSVGKCRDGRCGYCAGIQDCPKSEICVCKDGGKFALQADYRCISSACVLPVSGCGEACRDHGGI